MLISYTYVLSAMPIPMYAYLLYSWKISRAPIFEDFKDFLLTSKILSLNFWLLDKSIMYGQTLACTIYQIILTQV